MLHVTVTVANIIYIVPHTQLVFIHSVMIHDWNKNVLCVKVEVQHTSSVGSLVQTLGAVTEKARLLILKLN